MDPALAGERGRTLSQFSSPGKADVFSRYTKTAPNLTTILTFSLVYPNRNYGLLARGRFGLV